MYTYKKIAEEKARLYAERVKLANERFNEELLRDIEEGTVLEKIDKALKEKLPSPVESDGTGL